MGVFLALGGLGLLGYLALSGRKTAPTEQDLIDQEYAQLSSEAPDVAVAVSTAINAPATMPREALQALATDLNATGYQRLAILVSQRMVATYGAAA